MKSKSGTDRKGAEENGRISNGQTQRPAQEKVATVLSLADARKRKQKEREDKTVALIVRAAQSLNW